VEDIAGFLGSHPPFDVVDADELARIAAVTEPEVTSRGKAIFAQGAGPVESVWVVRSGSVEVIHDGRVLDLLGPGELFVVAPPLAEHRVIDGVLGLDVGVERRSPHPHPRRDIPQRELGQPLLLRQLPGHVDDLPTCGLTAFGCPIANRCG